MEILSWLPKDIHMEILSWLPAESLISSFKFVCKAWRNLIHDPDFVKMHLSRRRGGGATINGGGGRSSRSIIRKPGIVLYQVHLPYNCDYPPLDLDHLSSCAAATKLDFDFDFDFDDYDFLSTTDSRLVGSCNGLICLSINYDEDILLLNPSTRKYKVSPKQQLLIQYPSQFTCDNFVTYGFGSIDDNEYKVVRIANFYPPLNSEAAGDRSFQFQIHLYSMSSNSWRKWRGDNIIPFENIHDSQLGLFMNGSVHWIGAKVLYGSAWDMIVSFNIREEKFGQLPLPPCADIVGPYREGRPTYPYILNLTSLINVRGCLGSVYFSARTQMMDIELELWVMKEYGVGESWTKELVIRTSDSEPPRELSGFKIFELRSMTCSLAGDQIIIEGRLSFENQFHRRVETMWKSYGRRVLYDINKKKIDGDVIMEVDDFSLEQDQVDYIETLVSLKSSLQLPLSNNRKRRKCS